MVVLPFVANYKYAKYYQILIMRNKICFFYLYCQDIIGLTLQCNILMPNEQA